MGGRENQSGDTSFNESVCIEMNAINRNSARKKTNRKIKETFRDSRKSTFSSTWPERKDLQQSETERNPRIIHELRGKPYGKKED